MMIRSEYHQRPVAGFTLLEVVVALAVVALGLIAAFNLVARISSGSLHMKESTFAGWIAANEITRLRLSGQFPDVSQFDGDVEFSDETYRWRATVSETGVENLRRIDMDVAYADDPDTVIGRSVGFISPPPRPRLGGSGWTDAEGEGPGEAENLRDETQGGGQPADGSEQSPGQNQEPGQGSDQ